MQQEKVPEILWILFGIGIVFGSDNPKKPED
jgi:hypothetical protein